MTDVERNSTKQEVATFQYDIFSAREGELRLIKERLNAAAAEGYTVQTSWQASDEGRAVRVFLLARSLII